MLLTLFSGVVQLLSWLSGIGGWLHDRGQRQRGEIDTVARDQHIAIQVMKVALETKRTDTRAELEQKLKDGEL